MMDFLIIEDNLKTLMTLESLGFFEDLINEYYEGLNIEWLAEICENCVSDKTQNVFRFLHPKYINFNNDLITKLLYDNSVTLLNYYFESGGKMVVNFQITQRNLYFLVPKYIKPEEEAMSFIFASEEIMCIDYCCNLVFDCNLFNEFIYQYGCLRIEP